MPDPGTVGMLLGLGALAVIGSGAAAAYGYDGTGIPRLAGQVPTRPGSRSRS